jgi:hypothetical protein
MLDYVIAEKSRYFDEFHERSFATIFILEVNDIILEVTFIRSRSGYKRGTISNVNR